MLNEYVDGDGGGWRLSEFETRRKRGEVEN